MRDETTLQASLLNRLIEPVKRIDDRQHHQALDQKRDRGRSIDREPDELQVPIRTSFATIEQIRECVIQDLKHLLNSRRIVLEPPDSCRQVSSSVYVYGLGDFTGLSPRSSSVRIHIWQEIERTIALFEPRLKDVKVRIEGTETIDRSMRFRISALLVVDPVTEPISFDTYLDINRGEFVIVK